MHIFTEKLSHVKDFFYENCLRAAKLGSAEPGH